MSTNSQDKTTHFGFRKVADSEKVGLVGAVFDSVASRYDVMNDVMSFGMHRLWKRFTISKANVRTGQRILDIAAGTGDLAKAFAKQVGPQGTVILSDINDSMLTVGRNRLTDAGIVGNTAYVQADAERLPFTDNYFDCITIAFGLRNVTHKEIALNSIYRVLKPGGKVLILEFSHPQNAMINKLYEFYSFKVIPRMGKAIANDSASYQYLVESIRMHPNQETLKTMMETASFESVNYTNLNAGIVALHEGYKY